MRISKIRIQNFRNFADLDVNLGQHAVIVGENKIGKSNLLHALRLVLDPSLPDSARKLREEDFWDGLARPLGKEDRIAVSVDIADFESNENQLAVLAEHLVEPDPMVARLTYVWQPLPNLDDVPKKTSDYEFFVYGGERVENRTSYDVRRRLPMELMPALRDCEGDLANWSRSPLRPLLDKAASMIDREDLADLARGIDDATEEIANIEEVRSTAEAISAKLIEMVGSGQALDTALRFSPSDADKLIRALRLFIDGGRRGITDASLGSANLLFLALKTLEYEQLVLDGDRDHTFLAIEEPEAHLHPSLQRLIFRNYLRSRHNVECENLEKRSTILMTTHSPHIASVTPLKDFVLLRLDKDGNATEASSTADIDLSVEEVADLERYIDVNRGELLFAKGIILVEGESEKYLVPVLAHNLGYNLDELGIAVCSISGTNFYPYLRLIGPDGLDLPFSALTDYDPQEGKEPLGPNRVLNQMMAAVVDEETWDENDGDVLIAMSEENGIFMNSHTLEVDLFKCGLHSELAEAMDAVSSNASRRQRMKEWAKDKNSFDAKPFLKDINAVGKGRFAQRLASIIIQADTKACPDYIKDGIEYVAAKCRNY